jgi:uncharacterized membrane protein YcaP (DUF421 family)
MTQSQKPSEGEFAGDEFQQRDRNWRRAGLALLVLLAAGSIAGLYGQPTTVLRAAAIYLILMVVFRFAGHRTLAQITNFDLILVLIIGEATQNAMVQDDMSITTAGIAIITLVLCDMVLGKGKQRWPTLDKVSEGLPVVLVADGQPFADRMKREDVDLEDILAAARERQGLTTLTQIKYAVLEKNGGISIVPKDTP